MIPHRRLRRCVPALLVATAMAIPAASVAQVSETVRDEVMRQFETSMEKFIALAEAMPADRYDWSPGAGVMEVGQVLMHVARYNYMYPNRVMGVPLPEGVETGDMEAEREKARVLRALEDSRAWVRASVNAMDAAQLDRMTRLYGRDLPNWAVLVQLVSHMNEHLGQSIAYARMNDITPPWSQ